MLFFGEESGGAGKPSSHLMRDCAGNIFPHLKESRTPLYMIKMTYLQVVLTAHLRSIPLKICMLWCGVRACHLNGKPEVLLVSQLLFARVFSCLPQVLLNGIKWLHVFCYYRVVSLAAAFSACQPADHRQFGIKNLRAQPRSRSFLQNTWASFHRLTPGKGSALTPMPPRVINIL